MRFLYLFFCSFILFSCSSVEKDHYEDNFSARNVERDQKASREVANLKNLSAVKESQFQFVIKQMKEVITNYGEIKRQILKIEDRLNRILVRNVIKQQQSQTEDQQNVQTEPPSDTQTEAQAVGQKEGAVSSNENGAATITNNNEESATGNEKETVVSQSKEDESKPSSLLQEDIADDKDIFTDETTKENPTLQNQQKALEKVIPKDKASSQEKPLSLLKAEELFKQKSYESAISAFQKYRDENPSGQYYPEATFYIGQSFKELKMPIEAKVFFQEIVSSYPKSLWANRSQKILKE